MHSNTMEMFSIMQEMLWETLIHLDIKDIIMMWEEIQFTTVPFYFYSGHKLPMVEFKIDETTLLSFEEGKENLINWVNVNFK